MVNTTSININCNINDKRIDEKIELLVEGFPSGQRDQTVNLTAQPSKVRILLPPPSFYRAVQYLLN
jgi:hypothetical protein